MDPAPSPPAPPSTAAADALAAWPRSAQVAVAFLLGIVVTLIGMQAWTSTRWSSRPTEFERNPVLAYHVDLNRAERAELLQLPGVGPALAERIEGRRPYEQPQQLREVAGIGPATYERLRPYVYVGTEPETAEPARPRTVMGNASKGSKKQVAAAIDINRAGVDELQKLPGIGPVKAKAIVDTREKKPFQSEDDLRRVPGIGPKTLEQLRPHVVVTPDPSGLVAAE